MESTTRYAPVLLVMGIQNDIAKEMHTERLNTLQILTEKIRYAEANDWLVVYSLELHHARHFSFRSQGGSLPPHCVIETWGSYLAVKISRKNLNCDQVLRGLDIHGDSNDAFYTTKHVSSVSHLEFEPARQEYSHLKKILDNYSARMTSFGATQKTLLLLICGISCFYPVTPNVIHETAITASLLGYKTLVIKDAQFVALMSEYQDKPELTSEQESLDARCWDEILEMISDS